MPCMPPMHVNPDEVLAIIQAAMMRLYKVPKMSCARQMAHAYTIAVQGLCANLAQMVTRPLWRTT